jgi:tetratricopeptide (TPR) repeat protein
MGTGDDSTVVDRPRRGVPGSDADVADTDPMAERDSGPEPRFSKGKLNDLSELVTVDPKHYVLGPELARGGMGRIHAARDRRLGRDVAIKELLVDNESLARRFEREARITARLQHPSIVSVHEAGRWPDGKPFYAMKLVSGRSMHEAMKRAHTYDERIAFVPNILAVADAMAYAHSQRVIHRDLKPNNVILGEFGETVVIDWGIAKSLDDPEEPSTPLAAAGGIEGQTEVGSVLGTPGYMAPEQAFGESVDERADVFAIGVMMFHALTGRMPWKGSEQMIVTAMVGGPPRLADVVPQIAPDLAAIAERALSPKLDVRYRDARELADDLRRFTTGQLVGAHRYSTGELIKRWLRRHRTAVIVGAVAVAALATVGVISVRSIVAERRIAETHSERAEKRSHEAEDAMGFMLFEVAEKLRQAGRLELMNTVVRRAVDYYANVSDKDIDPTRLVSALAVTGGVLRSQGDLAGATAEFERARKIAETRQADGPKWRHLLANALNDLGETSYQSGDLMQSAQFHRKALAISEALVANDAADPRWQRVLAYSQRYLGTTLIDQGFVDEGIGYFRSAYAIRKRLVEAAGDKVDDVDLRDLMMGHLDLGLALARTKDSAAAQVELEAALALAKQHADADPLGTTWQRDVAVAHERLGNLFLLRGDLNSALAHFESSRGLMQQLAALDTANAEWQRRLAIAQDRVGGTQLELGQLEASLVAMQESVRLRRGLVKRDPTNARWQRDLSHALVRHGDVLLAHGDAKAALVEYTGARTIRDELVKKDPSNVKWQADQFSSRRRSGNALFALADVKAARTELEAAAALAADLLKLDTTAIDDGDIVDLHAKLGEVLRADGDTAAGTAELQTAITLAKKRVEREPTDARRTERVKQLEALLK